MIYRETSRVDSPSPSSTPTESAEEYEENDETKKEELEEEEEYVSGVEESIPHPPHRGELLADLSSDGDSFLVARGGQGGFGNAHFTTSVNRSPRKRTCGEAAQTCVVRLELKTIADVGLIGYPNAGKSSYEFICCIFLRKCSFHQRHILSSFSFLLFVKDMFIPVTVQF